MLSGISEVEYNFIVENLKRFFPNSKIIFFGSRFNGTSKKYSDLDVAIDQNRILDLSDVSKCRAFFEESNISFRIDFVDFFSCDIDFKNHILKSGVVESA